MTEYSSLDRVLLEMLYQPEVDPVCVEMRSLLTFTPKTEPISGGLIRIYVTTLYC